MSDKFKLLLKQIHFPQHEEAYNEIKSGSIESVKLFKSKRQWFFVFSFVYFVVFFFVFHLFHCFFHCLFLLINWCHSFKNTSGIRPQKILFQAPYCLLLYPFSPGTSIAIRYSKTFLTFLFQGAYHTSHARFFIIFSVRLRTSVSTSSLSFPFLRGFI